MARKKSRWNIGTIVFLVLLIYVLINVLIFVGKEKLTVYKVTEDKISSTYSLTGIALRNEKLLKAEDDGYITYYTEEGKRVKKSGMLYVLDKNGKVQKEFANQVEEMKGRGDIQENTRIKSRLSEFKSIYSDKDFEDVYDLKYDLKNAVLGINEKSLKKVMEQVKEQVGDASFSTRRSSISGIASFYSDSFDGREAGQIKASDFERENYRVTKLNSTDKVKKGDTVCRVTKSEKWTLAVLLDKEQYTSLKGRKTVTVKFVDDQMKAEAGVETEKKEDGYFAYLSLDQYLIRYIGERYVDIDLLLDTYHGLKIPDSAIVSKQFYQVPVKYITKGNNGAGEGFSVRTTSKDGNVKVEQKEFKIYKKTKNYCYLDPEEVEEGTTFEAMDAGDRFTVGAKKRLKGVYCTNQGYADFRPVQVIVNKDGYTIVETDTLNGIRLYDFVVLDSKAIKENQIIY